jgi:hypothetical protein
VSEPRKRRSEEHGQTPSPANRRTPAHTSAKDDAYVDPDDAPRRGWARRFTDEEMSRFETISRNTAHPQRLLDAVWDVVLGDVEGLGLTDARQHGFAVLPGRYAIADDQWQTLFGFVRATGTGDEELDLEHDDLWIANAPSTYP